MIERDVAWAELHDPATEPARLAAIAEAYPEFAAQIAAHPQCYDDLRTWAFAQQPPRPVVEASTASPPPRSTRRRSVRTGVALGAAILVLAGGAGAWALIAGAPGSPEAPDAMMSDAADTTPSAAPSGERQLAGPPVYIGDELEWFLLDESELGSYLPRVGSAESENQLFSVGETEGIHPDNEVCWDWLHPQVKPVIGVRAIRWDAPELGEYAGGSMSALQFPNGDLAADFFRARADTIDACASYQVLGPDETVYYTNEQTLLTQLDDGYVIEQYNDSGFSVPRSVYASALEGNVVVQVTSDLADDDAVDAEALLDAAIAQAAEARQQLTAAIGYR